MSTALLSTPGKIHELSDDLESHFFIMFYVSLHFVKHDKPSGLEMKFIFDQAVVSQGTGTHRGGGGKAFMYGSGLKVKFSNEPITVLVRGLLTLFKSLRDYHVCKNWGSKPPQHMIGEAKKLKDCGEIKKLFVAALKSARWQTDCDKVEDQYPPASHSTPQQKETVGLSYLSRDLTTESSTGKRKRGEDAPPPTLRQRRKKQ